MALFYVIGGVTILVILLFPHPLSLSVGLLLGLGVPSIIIGTTVYLLRWRIPLAAQPWMLAIGTVIVTTLTATAGSSSATVSFSFFYLWIVIYALLFLAPVPAAVQIGFAAIAYGSALTWLGQPDGSNLTAFEPTVTVIVIATTGGVVMWLSRAREHSEIDPLTLTTNRRGLDRVLDTALRRTGVTNQQLVVGMIDVDHFKKINDLFGHPAGDQLLEDLTRGWRAVLRTHDTLARIGGDEFVVVLPGCSKPDATLIMERLRTAALELDTTCSVGGALQKPDDTASLLLGRADSALYQAKSLGRNQVAWAPNGSHPAIGP